MDSTPVTVTKIDIIAESQIYDDTIVLRAWDFYDHENLEQLVERINKGQDDDNFFIKSLIRGPDAVAYAHTLPEDEYWVTFYISTPFGYAPTQQFPADGEEMAAKMCEEYAVQYNATNLGYQ